MLLLNPRRVADGLRSGELSEHAKARLLLWGTFLSLFSSRSSVLSYHTWGQLLGAVVFYTFFLAGIWSCYRLNVRLDDRRFIERYVCLSIPLWVWAVLGYTVPYYAMFYLLRARLGLHAGSYPVQARPFTLTYFVAAAPIYFLLLRHYFRRSASESAAS